jgi:predicted HTH transcriptional regulator
VKSTREGKPFCSVHIENAPYVQRILGILRERNKEEEKLNKTRGRIPKDGFFYRETLLLLRTKDFTAKGLARRLDISHHAAKRLIALVANDGLAKRSQTSRGDLTISGLGKMDLAEPRD